MKPTISDRRSFLKLVFSSGAVVLLPTALASTVMGEVYAAEHCVPTSLIDAAFSPLQWYPSVATLADLPFKLHHLVDLGSGSSFGGHLVSSGDALVVSSVQAVFVRCGDTWVSLTPLTTMASELA